jgi:hypothetical protein
VFRRIWNKRNQRVSAERLAGRLIAVVVVTSAVKRGVNLLKTRDQTRHRSVEMLRVYCRDVELFNGNAAAGLL